MITTVRTESGIARVLGLVAAMLWVGAFVVARIGVRGH